jgi:hypothetical protein
MLSRQRSMERPRLRSSSIRRRTMISFRMSSSRPSALSMRARSPTDATEGRKPRPIGSRIAARGGPRSRVCPPGRERPSPSSSSQTRARSASGATSPARAPARRHRVPRRARPARARDAPPRSESHRPARSCRPRPRNAHPPSRSRSTIAGSDAIRRCASSPRSRSASTTYARARAHGRATGRRPAGAEGSPLVESRQPRRTRDPGRT